MSPSEAEFLRFARWALPERSNATRGVVAEWLVARAVDADLTAPRGEWDDHDVTTRSGTTVEVKSAAYLQAWITENPRPIVFSGLKGRRLTADGASYEGDRVFRAQVYVFAVHTAVVPELYDVWDTGQWEFRVVPRAVLAALDQRTIRLPRLRGLGFSPVPYVGLPYEIERARHDA